MRLLCLYQHAPTPRAPGIYRHRVLLSELARRGWDVHLISSPINYMTGVAPPEYRRAYAREEIDGVTHHWVRAVERLHESKSRRGLNYVTFAAGALARGASLPRPDVIWASSPPLSVGTLGSLLARRFRRPWVLEVRDLWPESMAAVGWLPESSKLYGVLERSAHSYAQGADAVIVPTPGLVQALQGHGAKGVQVVTGAMTDIARSPDVRQRERERLGLGDDACLFVYAGAVGAANGLDMLLDAAAAVNRADVQIVLAGAGSAEAGLRQRIAREKIDTVRMIGAIPKEAVAPLLAAADVCLHVLRPDPLFSTALPTKVLEYLGAHRPVVTTVPGLPQSVVVDSGGGFAQSATGLAQELVRWAQMPADEREARGEQAFAYGQEHFGLSASVDRLEGILRQVAAGSRLNL